MTGKSTAAKRFWKRIDKSSGRTSCWPWTGPVKKDGYSGLFWFDNDHGYVHAHKAAFLLSGRIITKQFPHVLHKCHDFGFPPNRLCCNPLHLKAGDRKENAKDCVTTKTHRNSKKTHCHRGHELFGSNLNIRYEHGRQVRCCRTCRLIRNRTAAHRAYMAAYQRADRKKRRKEWLRLHPPIVKTTFTRELQPMAAPWLSSARKPHPLAVPIFYPDGSVFFPLTRSVWRGFYAKIDFEDFDRVRRYAWNAYWGHTTKSYYAATQINRKTVYLHRFILGLKDSNAEADHKNHDTLDTRKDNLRTVTRRGNTQNRKDNTSGFAGVWFDRSRNKWASRIQIGKGHMFLGRFISRLEAAAAYRKACQRNNFECLEA